MPKKKKSIWEQLGEKYVISLRNEDHFIERTKATLSVGEILSLILVFIFIVFIFSFLLFRFTGIRSFLGTTPESDRSELFQVNQKLDSLESVIDKQRLFIVNIKRVINGEDFQEDIMDLDSSYVDQIVISDPTSKELELRDKVSKSEKESEENKKNPSAKAPFSAPISGVISQDFNLKQKHFGTDIVAPKNTAIKAIADGIVVYSSWNVNDGYSMIIIHSDGYQSVYKHAEKLLKDINDKVALGEAIGIVGNSGENTTGYHLHFELWKDGVPQDPAKFFDFD